jgi:hypothetical protein
MIPATTNHQVRNLVLLPFNMLIFVVNSFSALSSAEISCLLSENVYWQKCTSFTSFGSSKIKTSVTLNVVGSALSLQGKATSIFFMVPTTFSLRSSVLAQTYFHCKSKVFVVKERFLNGEVVDGCLTRKQRDLSTFLVNPYKVRFFH